MKIDLKPKLVREVKETLATDIQMPAGKRPVFTAADLWNIRRNAKTARSLFRR